ncbi:MAG: HU family DNA-binding protein [Candidatus Sumerlaeaceae bacterium]|jgi:DNA-binding protein HU-beta
MTKQEVANLLCKKTGLSQKQGREAVEIFLSAIKDALKAGEKVSLVDFGTFQLKARRARRARKPGTGEQFVVPPKAVVIFKPGRKFRELVAKTTSS